MVFNGEDNCGKAEHELPFGTFDDAYQISKIEMEKVSVSIVVQLEVVVCFACQLIEVELLINKCFFSAALLWSVCVYLVLGMKP